jgi:hypothetical protein
MARRTTRRTTRRIIRPTAPRTTPHPARMRPQHMALARLGCPTAATRRADLDPREALIGEPESGVSGNPRSPDPGHETSATVNALMVCAVGHGYRALALSEVADGEPLIAMNLPETAPLGTLNPLDPLDVGPTCCEVRGR